MAEIPDQGNSALVDYYQEKIGEPLTRDEAYGYWLFVLGVVAGIAGLGLFLTTSGIRGQPSTVKGISIAIAALGLLLLIAGPLIRLPLQRQATLLTYVGLVVGLAGIAWFLFAYPQNWRRGADVSQSVIAVYAAGLVVMAFSAIIVPVITGPAEERKRREQQIAGLESEVSRQQAEIDEQQAENQRVREESKRAREQSEKDLADRDRDVDGLTAELETIKSSQARFEVYEDKGGKWRWRLRHRNSNVIADGGQGYASKQKAYQGLQSVKRNALGAGVFQFVSDDDEIDADVAAEGEEGAAEVDVPVDVVESKATFELYEDDAGDWRWRLRHENGNILSDCGQGYASKQKARQGMNSVRKNVQQADYLRVDPTAFEIYRDKAGQYRWRLIHKNGNVLADGGQGYSSRRAARKGVDSVMSNAAEAGIEEGER